jgi:hypothetical protein
MFHMNTGCFAWASNSAGEERKCDEGGEALSCDKLAARSPVLRELVVTVARHDDFRPDTPGVVDPGRGLMPSTSGP